MIMTHGELIKKLRVERGLTQAELAKGICSRTTLSVFENNGTYLSAEILFKYLDRLNVLPNEYMAMIAADDEVGLPELPANKDYLLRKIESLIYQGKSLSLHESIRGFYAAYACDHDVFYLYLLIQIESARSLQVTGRVQLNPELIADAKSYLTRSESFHSFDLLLFTSVLHTYTAEQQAEYYSRIITKRLLSAYDRPEYIALTKFIIRAITLRLSNQDYERARQYLGDLQEITRRFPDMDCHLLFMILDEKLNQGNQRLAQQLFETLRVIAINDQLNPDIEIIGYLLNNDGSSDESSRRCLVFN